MKKIVLTLVVLFLFAGTAFAHGGGRGGGGFRGGGGVRVAPRGNFGGYRGGYGGYRGYNYGYRGYNRGYGYGYYPYYGYGYGYNTYSQPYFTGQYYTDPATGITWALWYNPATGQYFYQ